MWTNVALLLATKEASYCFTEPEMLCADSRKVLSVRLDETQEERHWKLNEMKRSALLLRTDADNAIAL
jgi:hypothetical protein